MIRYKDDGKVERSSAEWYDLLKRDLADALDAANETIRKLTEERDALRVDAERYRGISLELARTVIEYGEHNPSCDARRIASNPCTCGFRPQLHHAGIIARAKATDQDAARAALSGGIYVASRASIPERSAMWRAYRADGVPIISTWIDEAGEGETACYVDLWDRITNEIAQCSRLVLYAEPGDFPLKGALIEVGIAIGMRKPIIVCLPRVELTGDTLRPIGSWIKHRLVTRIDSVSAALSGGKP